MTKEKNFIPTANPRENYLAHKKEIDAAIRKVLNCGWYILGKEVEAFENEFASYVGCNYGIGVANGTDAIEIALRAASIGSGDLVFTVSQTAVATIAAIERCGSSPVFIDITPETFTMDVCCLERTIDAVKTRELPIPGKPKAIVPVHLYGHPANMPAILEIANKFGLIVIEDCAQAHGATIKNQMVGSFGHMAAFSFYPTKNLGALGDGGMIVTNSDYYQKRLLMLRQYGWETRYISSIPGVNSRLDELQAAILRVKLHYLKSDSEKRRKIAKTYTKAIKQISCNPPEEAKDVHHVYHQYVIRTDVRDILIEHLKNHSLGTAILYPIPIHLQPAYKGRIAIGLDGLPITEQLCKEILSLPMYPELTDHQVDRVVDALLSFGELGA